MSARAAASLPPHRCASHTPQLHSPRNKVARARVGDAGTGGERTKFEQSRMESVSAVVQSMTNLFNDFFFAWGLPPLTTAGFLGCSVIQHYITYCQKPILTLLDG